MLFRSLVSDGAAMRFYADVRASLEAKKGNVSAQSSAALGNYATYSLRTNGSCYYVAQVERTVVIFTADDSCRDTVREIVKEFGY